MRTEAPEATQADASAADAQSTLASGKAPALATGSPRQSHGPSPERLLQLQRTIGNRGVARLLSRSPSQTGQVSQNVEEALIKPSADGETTFHWTANYDFEITDDAIYGIVKLGMDVFPGVSPDEATAARQDARKEFQRLFNGKFDVVEDGLFGATRRLYLGMDWILSPTDGTPHATVSLAPGAPATSEQTSRSLWHVAEPATVHAHETAHLFGLLDEYVDLNVRDRSSTAKTGVREDHSIMGAYPTEGVSQAEMKDRHALRIAQMIFKAAGKAATKLTVKRAK
jgi:hypothetical protein